MNRKKLYTYLTRTFLITYTAWWGLAFFTQRNLLHLSRPLYVLLLALGGFGPTISAISVLGDRTPKGVLDFIFSSQKNSFWYLVLFCGIQGAVVGLSSGEINPQIPLKAVPFILLSATLVGGGNEELGWRGTMQPELEKVLPFPLATGITGCAWMFWHIPLWFVKGAPQQTMNYGLYFLYGLCMSFWLATLYKKTQSVFSCAIFHGFSNVMMSLFLIQVNGILGMGLAASLVFCLWLYYREPKTETI